jgi:ATP:cob(I)alamin adenosyltransferase
MSVTTKTGDKGQTSLFTGERVDKDSLRVEVYGTIDEVDAALAMARAFSEKDEVTKRIYGVQQKLGRLMADFASLGKEPLITAADVKAMEDDITVLEDALPEQNSFIIPGDTKAGAMLDHARTVVRRAERLAIRLAKTEAVAESDRLFLNRLSDYCYLLMRLEEDVFTSLDEA